MKVLVTAGAFKGREAHIVKEYHWGTGPMYDLFISGLNRVVEGYLDGDFEYLEKVRLT